MVKKLSIIFTHYNEPEEKCYNSLASLDLQQNINWNDIEVLIINDHGEEKNHLSEAFLNQFKHFTPKYIIKDTNTGPGDARNKGIEEATGDYIMFIDIEDMFENIHVLVNFMQQIHPSGQDLIFTNWISPIKLSDGRYVFQIQQMTPTWVFGIFYRRAFLNQHNIRFLPYLVWNEEIYFNQKALALTDRVSRLDHVSVTWTHDFDNPTSITTSDGQSYSYRIMPSWIHNWCKVMEWKKSVNKLNPQETLQTLYSVYFMIHNWEWDEPKAKEYKEQSEQLISYYIYEFKQYFEQVGAREKGEIYKQCAMGSSKIPPISFDEWYKNMESLNITEDFITKDPSKLKCR